MSSLESTNLPAELPPCSAGFIWVIAMNTCLPSLARSRQDCPHGYYMHHKFKKCMRQRYDKKQQSGVIKKWLDSSPKKPRTTKKPPMTKPTTPYEGGWWSYNAGYGRDKSHP
ncbi:uncharacterized protein LOC128254148 [Drosophila gunungcola]|uniref:Uncharacterized protein n=1 Tax=Drosophila gunungcola TaxID=103775 RepID=A0A9Q0BQ28_9MUSC|nr:uncharacterized protein LOC128254148 [Drosophila gunungcola]KAI8039725.1 hypothetical protein M5D96_007147 [Drosophila gunungcola]